MLSFIIIRVIIALCLFICFSNYAFRLLIERDLCSNLFVAISLDREKRAVNSGDEPNLCKNQVLFSQCGIVVGATKSTANRISSNGNNGGYVPTVGRWGSEWPS